MKQQSTAPKGYLCLILHAHLPYVRHPESDYFLEENWLYESITETYIPLLSVFQQCANDKIPFRLTMSITPTLCSMLSDELLQQRYVAHLNKLIELSEKEVERTRQLPDFFPTAQMYFEKFTACKRIFVDENNCNILNAFKGLQQKGALEILTCGATHGYFPTMSDNQKAVRAQIQVAVKSYEKYFDRKPAGIWLPECGYYPGVETVLEEAGITYFFTDTHGILYAHPRPKYGAFAPVYCTGSHVAAFSRDIESSKAVWSAQEGYPGDYNYRDFYRDIGFDLDIDYIGPYIDPIGIRINTGIKYYKITGKTNHKLPYDYSKAVETAREHAGNFVFNRERQIEYLFSLMDRKPIVVAPYDAELFGHWWYEGPSWLDYVIRTIANSNPGTIELITPTDYLARNPRNQLCTPSFSSWGAEGYSEVWLNGTNDWIYRHLHKMEERMVACANRYPDADGTHRRTLNQMARELLLAESSDWAFILKTGTMVNYATRRTKEHIANFTRLYYEISNGDIHEPFLSLLESHNNIFPEIDYRVYR
jgi:1,4-alpha-glucan branching enzyme